MTLVTALTLLVALLLFCMWLSRRRQSGVIDFLTPMLAVYVVHYVTRSTMIAFFPDWLSLNPIVMRADESDLASAVAVTAAGIAAFTVAYLAVMLWPGRCTVPIGRLELPSLQTAVKLLGIGLTFRLITRVGASGSIGLPEWITTPVETIGWAALAGIFLASFLWGAARRRVDLVRARNVTLSGLLLIVAIDARFLVSREALLQPLMIVLIARLISSGASIRRIAVYTIALGLPLFIWIGAMKTYRDYDLGPGQGVFEAVPVVHQQFGKTWPQFVIGIVQDRFHGIDSLLVVRTIVPAMRPYEEGSAWSQILLSAFVPRALFPEKQVGWGTRFATQFWGMSEASAGQASVGISHLGTFYVYGGLLSCVTGMAVLGGGLALLARHLRGRRDVFGLMMFVLVAMTVLQVDRDLEVALGGVLKLLVLFGITLFIRPFRKQIDRHERFTPRLAASS
jgi:hypothetical protein